MNHQPVQRKKENEICQNCGKCCTVYWIFTDILAEAERFRTLSEYIIEVQYIKKSLWKIIFKLPCKHLITEPFEGFKCSIYNNSRPRDCYIYPRNFLSKDVEKEVLENEKKFCPLLKYICE